jgi:hypothetical protein
MLHLPTYALLRYVETVASTAARSPLAVDGRGLCGLLAAGCLAVATVRLLRGRVTRLARDAPVPPR